MHGDAGLAVVEPHAEQDLLAEVLHEAVEAEVEDRPHLALPVADGGGVGEVEQGDRLAGGPGGQVGGAVGVGRDPAVLHRGRVGLDPGAQVGERVDVAAAQGADHLRLHGRAGEGVDRQAVIAAGEPPALDPVGADRDPVAAEVAHVGEQVGLVVLLRLAEVLDQAVHHRPEAPARGEAMPAAQRGQRVDGPSRLARGDDVSEALRRGGDVPAAGPVGGELEAPQLRLVEEEPVVTRGDELGLGVVGRRRAVGVERGPVPARSPAGRAVDVLLVDEAREDLAALVEVEVAAAEPEEPLAPRGDERVADRRHPGGGMGSGADRDRAAAERGDVGGQGAAARVGGGEGQAHPAAGTLRAQHPLRRVLDAGALAAHQVAAEQAPVVLLERLRPDQEAERRIEGGGGGVVEAGRDRVGRGGRVERPREAVGDLAQHGPAAGLGEADPERTSLHDGAGPWSLDHDPVGAAASGWRGRANRNLEHQPHQRAGDRDCEGADPPDAAEGCRGPITGRATHRGRHATAATEARAR